jgi:hypothetical protein
MVVAGGGMHDTIRSTIVATAALFGVSIVLFWFRSIPLISADEIGYLGNARWLVTGSAPSMGYTMTYSAGYSLLLVPFEWLLNDPRAVYKGAMVLNALFVAATVPALVRLARDFEFVVDRWTPWLAVLIALWPSQLVQAYLALPEIALRLGFVLVVIAAVGLIRHGGWRYALGLTTFVMVCYALHQRTVVILPLFMVLIAIAKWRRSISWQTVAACVGIFAAAYLTVDGLNRVVQSALWTEPRGSFGVFMSIAADVLADPRSLAARIFGNAWYQLASTLLFVPLGALIAIHQVLSPRPAAVRLGAAFVILATIGVGLLGAASLIRWSTLDFLVYGRYLDVVTPVLFWFGVLGIASPTWRAWLLKWAPWLGAAALGCGALIYAAIAHDVEGRGINVIEVGAFLPILVAPVVPDLAVKLFLFAPIVFGMATVFCLSLGKTPRRMAMALGLVVLVTTLVLQDFYMRANEGAERRLEEVKAVYARAGDAPVSLDRSTSGGQIYTQQYMLARHFPVVDVMATPLPAGTVVTLGPRGLASVSGECLGSIGDDSNLVVLGQGDPKLCTP